MAGSAPAAHEDEGSRDEERIAAEVGDVCERRIRRLLVEDPEVGVPVGVSDAPECKAACEEQPWQLRIRPVAPDSDENCDRYSEDEQLVDDGLRVVTAAEQEVRDPERERSERIALPEEALAGTEIGHALTIAAGAT